jgi:membrane-bound ClpP family serine protease
MSLLVLAQDAAANGASHGTYLLWGFVLFALALALLLLELFIPSGGLIGVLCGVAAIASIVAFFMYDTSWGVGVALAYLILAPIVLVAIFKLWLNSPIARLMILSGSTGEADAADADEDPDAAERKRRQRLAELKALIGVEGVTETALRPVGTIRIKGQRIDGMAESGIIEANTPVVVTDVYDNQIKVRPC